MNQVNRTFVITAKVSGPYVKAPHLNANLRQALRSLGVEVLESAVVEEQPCEHTMGYRTVEGQRQCQTCGLPWDKVQEEYVLGKQG